jgi:hypothetical protein
LSEAQTVSHAAVARWPAAAGRNPRWSGLRLPEAAAHVLSDVGQAARLALLPFAVSRLVLFAAGWAAVAAFGTARVHDPRFPNPIQTWLSWDAVHYLRLAANGYPTSARAVDSGFFPLLPAALHLAGADPVASLGLALVAGFAGVAALCGLTRAILGEEAARRTAWVACWWPEAFVLSAVYTEGPFLLLAVGATWAAWRRQALLAAALAAGAALLRPTGVLLAVPLLMLLPAGRPRLAALAPLAGAAGFAVFLWVHTGSPLAWITSQAANHKVHPGTLALAALAGREPDDTVGLALLALTLVLAVRLAWMRELGAWRLPALALTAVLLLPPLTSGTLGSFGRYAAAAFPLYWGAAGLRLGRLAPFAVAAAAVFTMACAAGRIAP